MLTRAHTPAHTTTDLGSAHRHNSIMVATEQHTARPTWQEHIINRTAYNNGGSQSSLSRSQKVRKAALALWLGGVFRCLILALTSIRTSSIILIILLLLPLKTLLFLSLQTLYTIAASVILQIVFRNDLPFQLLAAQSIVSS